MIFFELLKKMGTEHSFFVFVIIRRGDIVFVLYIIYNCLSNNLITKHFE